MPRAFAAPGRRAGRLPLGRRLRVLAVVAVPSLAAATLVIAFLETFTGVPNASAVYLVAVVASAIASGTTGAIVASVAAFLLYDFFFTVPTWTFTIREPGEWLSVTLLLFVGIVVGQLAALQRSRTELALSREREARALFQVSRALATRASTAAVLPSIATILRNETASGRVWLALGADVAAERVVADTGSGPRPSSGGIQQVLRRMPGDAPAEWVRVHRPGGRGTRGTATDVYRVRISAGDADLGSVWATRERAAGEPDRAETRLLAAAADQIGQALALDRLAADAQEAEIARQSDALKSALLQSVSHDLRSPLATIRAAAGTLRPESALGPGDREQSVDLIDREVQYLDRVVTNLLDLSRIEAGALRADRDVLELDDLAHQTVDRLAPRLAGRPLEVDVAPTLVEVDPVFLDEALTNVLENAVKYTPAGTAIRLRSGAPGEARTGAGRLVRLTVEDAGPGVPPQYVGRLFEKFYRVPGSPRTSRSGTGIGLAVVRGLIEATGGSVTARRSELGGLAIDIDLPLPTSQPAAAGRPSP